MNAEQKRLVRKQLRDKRKQLTPDNFQYSSQCVVNTLLEHSLFKSSQHIALYFSHENEVDTSTLFTAMWQQGKHCYLPITPKLSTEKLHFAKYQAGDTLVNNHYAMKEPQANTSTFPAESLDLVLIPLVAFDSQCHRLGRGAGYYDKTFAFKLTTKKLEPLLIGLAYEWQKVADFSREPWDIPLNYVITEKCIYTR